MRVRLNRSTTGRHQDHEVRPRLRAVEPSPRPAHTRPEPPVDEFIDERRLRAAGGPDDTATYHCACGFVFEADVSTSVSCPHCGSGQAW
jgi:hypothetical protein